MQTDRYISGGAAFAVSAAVMCAAVFTASTLLPDRMIEPKWYAACFAGIVGGIALVVLKLSRPSAVRFGRLWRGFEAACVVTVTAQAAFSFCRRLACFHHTVALRPGALTMWPGSPRAWASVCLWV